MPDFSRQGRIDQKRKIFALRLTMQLTPKNKLSLFWDEQPQCSGAGVARHRRQRLHEQQGRLDLRRQPGQRILRRGTELAETGDYASTHQKVQQVKYTAPTTNKLLARSRLRHVHLPVGIHGAAGQSDEESRARAGAVGADLRSQRQPGADVVRRLSHGRRQPEVPLVELADRLHLRAHLERGGQLRDRRAQHEVRLSGRVPPRRSTTCSRRSATTSLMQYTFNTPCTAAPCPTTPMPTGVTMQSGVFTRKVRTQYYAFYAQEQWTQGSAHAAGCAALRSRVEQLPRAADRSVGHDPDRDRPAARQSGIKGYNDLSPRIGVAYDLFGNGKTSLKGNVGRYLHPASNQGRYINANPSELVSTITGSLVDRQQRQLQARLRSAERPGAESDDHRIDRHLRRVGGPELRTTPGPGTQARRLDSQRLGRASVRLAVRHLRSAGADAESLGRGRLLPPMVADLRAADVTDNILTAAGRLHAVQRHRAERFASAERRRLRRARTSTTSPRLRTRSVPSNVQTAANDFGRYIALLGRLRRHRAGASAQRADPAGRHEHRTSGLRSVRAA